MKVRGRTAVGAAAALVVCVAGAVLLGGGETYGPDDPMPLQVAARIHLDSCVDRVDGQDRQSYGLRYASVDECIVESAPLTAMVLDDMDTSVIGPDGTAIRSYAIGDEVAEWAMAMWRTGK